MTQFFGQTFWRALMVIAILYGLALLGYGSDVDVFILLGLAAGAAVLAYKRLDHALLLVFIELFSNPHGILLSQTIGGFSLTLRMAIFIGVMLGWGMGVLTKRYRLEVKDSRIQIFFLLALAAALGLIVGVLRRDPPLVFGDGNAYLYLLYLLPILSVDWNMTRRGELLQVLAAGAVWICSLSLVLLYIFTHFGESVLQVTYYFFRDLRIAEITGLGTGVYRVFIQSQVFSIIFGFLLLSFAVFTKNRRWFLLLSSLLVATTILALSRSFWMGLVPSVVFILMLLWKHLRPTFKQGARFIGSSLSVVMLSVLLITVVILFPIPSQDLTGSDLALTLRDRTTDSDDVAIVSRWNLLTPMVNKIFESPLIGHGFGASVTFVTDDPRVREIHPDGTWTTSSMEWGWLELWIKMGILGPAAFLYAAYEFLKRLWAYRWTDQAWLGFGLMAGLVFIFATHFFSPYLNHPIGLGYMLFLVPFLPIKKPAEAGAAVSPFSRVLQRKEASVLASKR
ncbi:O-antigen ligase family protein [Candidatus Uhrbacteria bacterium]|nr:O-antigen ligase family protein [Candidatus Uhrbacteria bacterium]